MAEQLKIKMKDIVDNIEIKIRAEEMVYCFNDSNDIKEFIESYQKIKKIQYDDLVDFFLKNEDKIDKKRFLLLQIKNYKEYIKDLKDKIKKVSNNEIQALIYLSELKTQEKMLAKLLKYVKGVNNIAFGVYCYDTNTQRYEVKILDSKEIIDGKPKHNKQNIERYDKINSNPVFNELAGNSLDTNQPVGMEWLLQAIILTDLYAVFNDSNLGEYIRTMILENHILDENIITKEELTLLRKESFDRYNKFIEENTIFEKTLGELNKTLRQYVDYLDMDKLILVAAFRFIEGIENKNIQETEKLYQTLNEILKLINDNTKEFKYTIQDGNDPQKVKEIKFSEKDIRQCLAQFTSNSYLTKADINEYKQKINNEELNLYDIDDENIDIIYSPKELEEISILNEDNLMYVLNKFQWSNEKIIEKIIQKGSCSTELLNELINCNKIHSKDIIEFYTKKILDINQIQEISGNIDLTEEIDINKLVQLYDSYIMQKNEKDKEEKLDDYKRYLTLYKDIIIKDDEKQLQTYSDELMEIMVEGYTKQNREAYLQKVKDFYNAGILTLDSLLDWDTENIITTLYNDKLITLEKISQLAKKQKLSYDYVSNLYLEIIDNKELDYDERLKYLYDGFISEDKIFELYNNNMIFESDMYELAKKQIIRQQALQTVIDNRTKEKIEETSSIKLGNLNSLTKRNNNIYVDFNNRVIDDNDVIDEYDTEESYKKPKLIIDPNERQEFIDLFKAKQAEAYLDEDNPFYNYEFFVIPDETGDIGLNSVVIAERFYENKETERKFSTDNATYFFKYKDLLVLGNMKKSEMTKQRKNIVFTVNHNLATEKRNGSWAVNVIYSMAKTMMSNDLKEYSKDNQAKIVLEKLSKVYSHEEIMKIIEKSSEIDSGDYICEIQETNDGAIRCKKSNEDDGNVKYKESFEDGGTMKSNNDVENSGDIMIESAIGER